MDIKEKISGLAADITISTQGDWIAEIPVESFRMVAERVCHDPEEPMDYLRDIVGMEKTDWELYIIWSLPGLISRLC